MELFANSFAMTLMASLEVADLEVIVLQLAVTQFSKSTI